MTHFVTFSSRDELPENKHNSRTQRQAKDVLLCYTKREERLGEKGDMVLAQNNGVTV